MPLRHSQSLVSLHTTCHVPLSTSRASTNASRACCLVPPLRHSLPQRHLDLEHLSLQLPDLLTLQQSSASLDIPNHGLEPRDQRLELGALSTDCVQQLRIRCLRRGDVGLQRSCVRGEEGKEVRLVQD